MSGPAPGVLSLVPFVSVDHMMRIVWDIGVERMIVELAGYIEAGLPPLGAVRQDSAHRRPFGRRRDRTDADQRRRDLRLQIRQRPSQATHAEGRRPSRRSASCRTSAAATRCSSPR